MLSDTRAFGRLLIGKTHFIGEGGVGLPLGRGAGSGLLHHLIDLLQSQPLGLRDEEVGVNKGAGAERAPDEEHLGAQVALVIVDHVGGNNGNDLGVKSASYPKCRDVWVKAYAVPEPVGRGRESDTAGTDRQREDLADHDPGTRTPGAGEEEDVDTD